VPIGSIVEHSELQAVFARAKLLCGKCVLRLSVLLVSLNFHDFSFFNQGCSPKLQFREHRVPHSAPAHACALVRVAVLLVGALIAAAPLAHRPALPEPRQRDRAHPRPARLRRKNQRAGATLRHPVLRSPLPRIAGQCCARGWTPGTGKPGILKNSGNSYSTLGENF